MATFQLQGPDGGTYQVDAPDAASAVAALHGGAPQAAAPPAPALSPAQQDPGLAAKLAAAGYGKQPPISDQVKDVGGRADDLMRQIASGVTLGGADRLAAAAGTATGVGGDQGDYSGNLAKERAATAASAQELGAPATLAANIGGNVLSAAALPVGALALPAAGMARAGKLFGIGAGTGAVGGGLASPDWTDVGQTAQDIGVGGAAGGTLGVALPSVASGVGGSVNYLANALRGGAETGAPTLETIGPMKTAAYKAADDLGAAYRPEAIQDLAGKITSDAQASRLNPLVHPKAAGTIDTINTAAASDQPMTLTQLDQLRQVVGRDLGKGSGDAEQFFGNQIRGNIDSFIQNAGPDAMASGAGPEAAAAIQNARDLNTRFAKSEALTDAMEHAKDLAGGSGSGANLDNATRQALRTVQDSRGGWTPDEAELLQQGIRGGTGQNLLRRAGKLAPTGLMGGMEALGAVAGALTHGAPGLAIPAALGGVGMASKSAADAMTRANARNVMATILAGGSRPSATTAALPNTRAAVAAALAGSSGPPELRRQGLLPR